MTEPAPSPGLGRGASAAIDADVVRTLVDRAVGALPFALAVAAAVLALTSTGSMVVAAVLLGVAAGDRRTGLAALLAVTAVAVRFATASFDEVAGIQSVLGAAGDVGPTTAAASAWLAAGAVVLAARRSAWSRATPAPTPALVLAAGSMAAAIVAGPGPGGGIELRVLATVVAVVAAWAVVLAGRWRAVDLARPWSAPAAGLAAVALAAWPS